MSIKRLIESIGLSATELRSYLLAEVDEFLEADQPAAKEEEFGDILFALMAMSWAHAGRHYVRDSALFEPKLRQRLRTYAAVTRYPRRYLHDRIAELHFGVLHIAFGQFTGQWQALDPFPNGTVAEISLLTDAPFGHIGGLANHCILTFDDTQQIEYELLYAASDVQGGSTIRCRIPNFLYLGAKAELAFQDAAEYLSMQVLAALDGIQFLPNGFVHFHSWEGGFLAESDEFRAAIQGRHILFSPYLTIGPLHSLINTMGGTGWTMTPDELAVASRYETKLISFAQRVILESNRDLEWYQGKGYPCRLDGRSFASRNTASIPTHLADEKRLLFIAGGRPVREKGFVELCREFAAVCDWASATGLEVSLSILCLERVRSKRADYVSEIERTIAEHDLGSHVLVESKLSVGMLRSRIAAASALIVPSLYDPFCLMPTYAMDVETPSFVSTYAGVSENIVSATFRFDPLKSGDLARAVDIWYRERPPFQYQACFPSYDSLYLETG